MKTTEDYIIVEPVNAPTDSALEVVSAGSATECIYGKVIDIHPTRLDRPEEDKYWRSLPYGIGDTILAKTKDAVKFYYNNKLYYSVETYDVLAIF